jgi:KUP system potassium uptake protein
MDTETTGNEEPPERGAGTSTHVHVPAAPRGRELAKLALGALGIVYGDIGTSPLYAIKECVNAPHGVPPTPENVLGVLSLVFWSMIAVVVVKYLVFVVRADNDGEGGILALMALAWSKPGDPGAGSSRHQRGRRMVLLGLAMLGAALLYGDGMITPAISVLSAVEGLSVATHALDGVVIPLTCAILIGLFLIQKHGTGGIGAVFGPVMLLWFVSLTMAGLPAVLDNPEVLAAVNPLHAVTFFGEHRMHGFLVLGSVVLCITGGEALYADMGHFGRRPIRVAWYLIAFPALLTNYFGQGALLLTDPSAAANPFYALVKGPWLYPMVAIATMATVVASQALISGAFSLTQQAVQLGLSPRVTIVHTSGKAAGQIYVPEINWMLMVACVLLVLSFQESTNLAAAYGVAVTGTMAITSVLFFVVARERWGWSRARAGALLAFFLLFDLSFLAANLAKVAHGGWFPLVVGVLGFLVMWTWRRGREILAERFKASSLPLQVFLADIEAHPPHRVRGTAVFLSSTARGTPNVLLHHFKHNKVLHETVVILTIVTDEVPEVRRADRLRWKAFGHGFWAVTAHYGFMQTPNVLDIVRQLRRAKLPINENDTSFYLGRETLVQGETSVLPAWQRRLFAFLSRNGKAATDFFGLPPNRVVELGTQVEL